MSKKGRHVVSSTNIKGGWAVRQSGAERASKVFSTQQEAVKYARTLAKKEQSELYIHGRDGRIRGRNSYGKDPYPPQDKK